MPNVYEMILKILLSISGKAFCPDNAIPLLKGQYTVANKNNFNDQIFENRSDVYEFGSVTLWHPKKFAIAFHFVEYEEFLVDFLLDNYDMFIKEGAEEFQFFIEMYSDDNQCNYEILGRKLLQKLQGINIAFPISFYQLPKKEYKQWEKEIKENWV